MRSPIGWMLMNFMGFGGVIVLYGKSINSLLKQTVLICHESGRKVKIRDLDETLGWPRAIR